MATANKKRENQDIRFQRTATIKPRSERPVCLPVKTNRTPEIRFSQNEAYPEPLKKILPPEGSDVSSMRRGDGDRIELSLFRTLLNRFTLLTQPLYDRAESPSRRRLCKRSCWVASTEYLTTMRRIMIFYQGLFFIS